MSGYSLDQKSFDKSLDLAKLKPYGDTMNDGKVQVSFTLPIPNDDKGLEAAKEIALTMGLEQAVVALNKPLDLDFTYYVVYGNLSKTIDYQNIKVTAIEQDTMSMKACDAYISEHIGREVVVIGASTGTDAHTVGIDAIMNMKGYAGHYGLERYKMIEAFNMGSQVENVDFIRKAIELKADVLLVSQTVTQKDVHIQNLTNLVEMVEAEGIREKIILICGGPRISHQLAKELGYDAGFGGGKFAEDVATYLAKEIDRRLKEDGGN